MIPDMTIAELKQLAEGAPNATEIRARYHLANRDRPPRSTLDVPVDVVAALCDVAEAAREGDFDDCPDDCGTCRCCMLQIALAALDEAMR